MSDATPWLLCFGTFIIYPAVAFVVGFWIGRNGMPFSIQIKRRRREEIEPDF